MNIKIDDKKVIYLVTLLFCKDGNDRKFEMNQSLQKNAKDEYDAISKSILILQTRHNTVQVMLQAAMQLTPSMFLEEKIKKSNNTKILKLKP